ncbi:hypothetical protein JYU34_017348 [Plutella xylostella]|uniref:Uncharacterized protein n=1 Tax=Plutella xylostella TaxID=51655 RepID=A0ABQ7Q156_PLUXY|nr:hypothetical protein JYU34_017348 [Plutella xylostella]
MVMVDFLCRKGSRTVSVSSKVAGGSPTDFDRRHGGRCACAGWIHAQMVDKKPCLRHRDMEDLCAGQQVPNNTGPAPVLCGIIPKTCESLKCVFEKSGWIKKHQLVKSKVISDLDKFAEEHPAWYNATQAVKATCVAQDLPAQGVFINCPAYDVLHCAQIVYYRSALPEQWSTSPDCLYPRQFTAACAFCPEDCFSPQIPYRSCNACLNYPNRA